MDALILIPSIAVIFQDQSQPSAAIGWSPLYLVYLVDGCVSIVPRQDENLDGDRKQ
jgi:hypothetical protein